MDTSVLLIIVCLICSFVIDCNVVAEIFVAKNIILDEMTNNLDLQTRDHVIQVLQGYPGAMLVISHDADFLAAIEVCDWYQLD